MVAKTVNRKFVKFLARHGISIEQGGKHILLRKNGKVVATMSSTGSAGTYEMFAVQKLVRSGAIKREDAKYHFG
jgi:hypothetical protein